MDDYAKVGGWKVLVPVCVSEGVCLCGCVCVCGWVGCGAWEDVCLMLAAGTGLGAAQWRVSVSEDV